MKSPEQISMQRELTELLEQMNERQLHKAARFMELFIRQGMPYEDAKATVEAEFPKV